MATKKEVQAPVQTNENKKENTTVKKTYLETFKTILIAILITSIVAFVAGMKYQQGQTELVKSEASAIVKNVQVSVKPVVKQ